MLNGKAFELFKNEILTTTTEGSKSEKTARFAAQLDEKTAELTDLTQKIIQNAAQSGVEVMLADATLYLEYFGLVVVAWMWLKQGIVADKALQNGVDVADEKLFMESKLATMRFFFEYELPKTQALRTQLLNFDKLTVSLESAVLVWLIHEFNEFNEFH